MICDFDAVREGGLDKEGGHAEGVKPKVKGKVRPASTRTFAYRIYTMSRHETAYNDISR